MHSLRTAAIAIALAIGITGSVATFAKATKPALSPSPVHVTGQKDNAKAKNHKPNQPLSPGKVHESK